MSAQQYKENKVRYSTDFIVSDFTDFFGGDQKRKKDQITDRKKIKMLKRLKIIALSKYWSVVSIFYEFPEHHMEK